jgi:hypothetical protein
MVWDFFLLFFAFSTTNHCKKLKWEEAERLRTQPIKKKSPEKEELISE